MRRYELVIFDFDDTIGHLTVRWDLVKKELVQWADRNGIEVDPKEHVIIISNKVSETDEGKKKVIEVFRRFESECVRKKTWLMFPSMVELLKNLRKARYKIAIATGNNVKTIKDILKAEGLEDLVGLIVGIDSVRFAKPDPETLEIIFEKLGMSKEKAVFIGNSDFDRTAGQNAGLETIIIRTLWEDDVAMLRERLLLQSR